MNQEQITYLNQLSNYYDHNIVNLMDTFNNQITKYVHRDLTLGKPVELINAYVQSNRALAVMDLYLASQNSKGVK